MPSSLPEPMCRIRADVQGMHPYMVQDAKGMVKLDAMENPHRLPAELQSALGQRLGALALNRYPSHCVTNLRTALLQYAGVTNGFGMTLGNGSDELISLLAMACARPWDSGGSSGKASVLAPEPGFVMYAMSAQLQGLNFVGVPLTEAFALDVPAMLEAITRHSPALTYLAYPNNPTANLWDDAAIEAVIDAAGKQGGLVVIDEAYQPFAARSYIDRLMRHSHVLLLRTLSKFGLAGVRLGYLIGPDALIQQIDKVRPPYNISVLNAECALFALEHADVFAQQAATLRTERERLQTALRQIPHLHVYPSQGNMVLVRCTGAPTQAANAHAGMKERGVLVKNVSTMHPMLANCLRLTVGSAEENTAMLAALQASL